MTEEWIVAALGGGWLGKVISGLGVGTIAWFARRPAEKAVMMTAVDARVTMLLESTEVARKAAVEQASAALARCDHVEKLHTEERERCDRQLAEHRAEIAAMRAEIDRLMKGPVATYQTINLKPLGVKKP